MNTRFLATTLSLLLPFGLSAQDLDDRSLYPAFDRQTDILLAQYDCFADADDLHAQAALGSLLIHPDWQGINCYAVLGATGAQKVVGFIGNANLMDLIFGPEGDDTWTYAWDGKLVKGVNWNRSVERVKNKLKPILLGGGRVWVQEGGQSDITADWMRALLADGVSASTIKDNVYVIQHSQWNHSNTSGGDRTYVETNATWIKIHDGNNANNNNNNRTPDYNRDETEFMISATSAANPNADARAAWSYARDFVEAFGFNNGHSTMQDGGVDFSDMVGTIWILDEIAEVYTVEAFWAKYVTNSNSGNLPGPIPLVISPKPSPPAFTFVEEDGLVVCEVESIPGQAWQWVYDDWTLVASQWEERTAFSGFTGTSYLEYQGPGPRSHNENPLLDQIGFNIKITNPGSYQFAFRSQSGSGANTTNHIDKENDSFLTIAGGDFYGLNHVGSRIDLNGGYYKIVEQSVGAWSWDFKLEWDSVNERFVRTVRADFASPGVYQIILSGRSHRHSIDRLVMWNVAMVDEATAKDLSLEESPIESAANEPPTVSFQSPSNNLLAVGYEQLEVEAQADDGDGSVVAVQLFLNDQLVSQRGTAPFVWNLDTDPALRGLPAGLHELQLVAFDDRGGSAEALLTLSVQRSGTLIGGRYESEGEFDAGGNPVVPSYVTHDGTLVADELSSQGYNIKFARLGSVTWSVDTDFGGDASLTFTILSPRATSTRSADLYVNGGFLERISQTADEWQLHQIDGVPLLEGPNTIELRNPNDAAGLHVDFMEMDLFLPKEDQDRDGIDDNWERKHFGNLNQIDGSLDTDLDGVDDFFEYLRDSNPRVADNHGFGIGADRETDGVVIEWEVAPGRVLGLDYEVLFSSDLGSWRMPDEGEYSLEVVSVPGKTILRLMLTGEGWGRRFISLGRPVVDLP